MSTNTEITQWEPIVSIPENNTLKVLCLDAANQSYLVPIGLLGSSMIRILKATGNGITNEFVVTGFSPIAGDKVVVIYEGQALPEDNYDVGEAFIKIHIVPAVPDGAKLVFILYR